MRVLVIASPPTGHVLPLLPIATALREAGHEVVVGTTGDALTACPPELHPADVVPGSGSCRCSCGSHRCTRG